jgi:hypothetical protein
MGNAVQGVVGDFLGACVASSEICIYLLLRLDVCTSGLVRPTFMHACACAHACVRACMHVCMRACCSDLCPACVWKLLWQVGQWC